jgi:hypothetical protein
LVAGGLSLLILDDYFASLLFNLVKKLLGMTPDLSTRSSFDKFLNLLPVFSIKTQGYMIDTVR